MKLSDICDVYSGYALKEFNNESEGFPVIKIGNILANGSLFLDDCQYSKENINEKYFSKFGDIYVALSGATTGKIGIMQSKEKYIINQRVGIVRKRDNDIPESYIKYFLLHQTERILSEASGCAQPNISPKQIALYEVPNYENEKILSIVSSLDRISNIIKLRKQQLQQLDDLVKVRFIEMFGGVGIDEKGWGLSKLGDVCEINPKKNNETKLQQNLNVSFIPMPAISEKGEIDTSETRCYEEVKKGFTYFKENDVLFAKITPCMENGKGAVAKGLCNGIGFGSTEFHVLRPIENVSNPYWIYATTVFKQFRIDAESNMTGSAGQKRVPASFLESYKVSVPPIELQNEFAMFVEQTDKSKAAVQKALDEAQTLFDSLMQKYFG